MLCTPTRVVADGKVFPPEQASGPGILRGLILTAGDAAGAHVILYDGVAAPGDPTAGVLADLKVTQGLSTGFLDVAIPFQTGVYADITGTGAVALVYL